MKKQARDGKGAEVRTAGGRLKTQPSPRLELMVAAASLAWASSFPSSFPNLSLSPITPCLVAASQDAPV